MTSEEGRAVTPPGPSRHSSRWMRGAFSAASEWPRLLAWACLGVLVFCLSVARVSQSHMDDDNLYLAYAAQSGGVGAPELEQRLIDRTAATPHCEEQAHRLALRLRYTTNYAGYAAVQASLQHAAALFVAPGPARIIAGTLAVKFLFLLVLSIALAIVGLRCSDRELELAILCAFTLMVALDIASKWVPTILRVEVNKPVSAIGQFISSFFVIAKAHSYFGVTPRNAALL
ncbi:MAG TPA: hypothetical protein VJU61_14165, partial [Polyangiaceae bacterium]|nr:hypothetical protein [Polyangiaceae bacterium]